MIVQPPHHVVDCFRHGLNPENRRPWTWHPALAHFINDPSWIEQIVRYPVLWSMDRGGWLYLMMNRNRDRDLQGVVVLDRVVTVLPDTLNLTVWVNNAEGTEEDPASYWYGGWREMLADGWTVLEPRT